MKFLFFGAHPDDCDFCFGGTALLLIRGGHQVKFVSVCNGDRGHQTMTSEMLARRRYAETQAVAATAGLAEYQVLNNHDCELEPDLENRREIIRVIRRFQPDMVISHRRCDYHADHRATAQLVEDAAYLLKVPLFCPDTPIPGKNPVFAYSCDRFTSPRPFRPDAAVIIDDVLEDKFKMMACHESQYFEWLPFDKGFRNMDFSTWEKRRAFLDGIWGKRCREFADMARETLVAEYGEAGKNARCAEAFELSEYGCVPSLSEFREMFR